MVQGFCYCCNVIEKENQTCRKHSFLDSNVSLSFLDEENQQENKYHCEGL